MRKISGSSVYIYKGTEEDEGMTLAAQATLSICSRRPLEGTGSFRHGSFGTFGRQRWGKLVTESNISVPEDPEYPHLEMHTADLTRLFQRLGAAPQEIPDLIQQTFTRVLEQVRAGEVIGNPGGYCFRAGTHLYVSNLRRQGIALVDFDSEVLEQPPLQPNEVWRNEPQERVLAAEEINELVQDASTTLGDQGSKVFLLERVEGLDDQETAKRLGMSEHTVRRHKTKVNKWCKARKEGK